MNYSSKYDCIDKYVGHKSDHRSTKCIEENVLKEYLLKHKSEVKAMVITEFNEEVYRNGFKAVGKVEVLISLARKSKITVADVAEELKIDVPAAKNFLVDNGLSPLC